MNYIELAIASMSIICLSFSIEAQEFAINQRAEQCRQRVINQTVINKADLVEGFEILRKQDPEIPSFYDFLDRNLLYDEDEYECDDLSMNVHELIEASIDVISDKMKGRFLIFLNSAIKTSLKFDQIKDPVFLYVMANKDGSMQFSIYDWLNSEDAEGLTPLHLAVCARNIYATRMLINMGVDLNVKMRHGWTPLHAAAFYNYEDMACILLDAGAEVNNLSDYKMSLLDRYIPISFKCNYKRTPLQTAVIKNNIDVMRLLIDKGANVNLQDDSKTPLHIAVLNHNVYSVQMLIAAGADLNIQDEDGSTPLHRAVYHDYVDIAHMLLEAGADFTIEDGLGDTVETGILSSRMELVLHQFQVKKHQLKGHLNKSICCTIS